MTVPAPSPHPNPTTNLKALWFSPVTSKLLLPRKATSSRRSVGSRSCSVYPGSRIHCPSQRYYYPGACNNYKDVRQLGQNLFKGERHTTTSANGTVPTAPSSCVSVVSIPSFVRIFSFPLFSLPSYPSLWPSESLALDGYHSSYKTCGCCYDVEHKWVFCAGNIIVGLFSFV